MSVRGGKAAVVKARVTRRLFDDLRRHVPGKAAVPRGAVQLEVGVEYRLTDEHERIASVGILTGLARMANVNEGAEIRAASW